MRFQPMMRKALLCVAAAALPAPVLPQVSVEMVPAETDSSNQAAWWRPMVVKGDTTYVRLQ